MSTEELASMIIAQWQRIVAEEANRVPGHVPSDVFLRGHLAGLMPIEACLIGFRLAQGTCKTPAGDLNASVIHALNASLRAVGKVEG